MDAWHKAGHDKPNVTVKLVAGAACNSNRKTAMQHASRYHPLLVTLHWLLAILILAALIVGFFLLAAMPDTDPQKIGILRYTWPAEC